MPQTTSEFERLMHLESRWISAAMSAEFSTINYIYMRKNLHPPNLHL